MFEKPRGKERKRDVALLSDILSGEILKRDELGENLAVEVRDIYQPEISEDYRLKVNITSSRIDELNLTWRPDKNILEWSHLYINEKRQGQGIGLKCTEIIEQTAIELGVDKLLLTNIYPASLEFWKNREGYVLEQTPKYDNAVRKF